MASEAPFDFNGIDSAVHGPIRLGVLSALSVEPKADFTTLKKRLQVSDGALGIHLQKLEDIGYISCRKEFVGRRPKSSYKLTRKGAAALTHYLNEMQRLIDSLQ